MSTPADRLQNFGFLIKDIGRLYTKLFEYEADHLGITLAEAKVLAYLSRNPGLSQVQLAELTGVEPMSLVRILDRMEADKRIERRAHPTDRRARQLHLHSQGQSTLDQIWKLSGQVRSQALAGFKVEERNNLIGLLERVHEQMLHMMAEQTEQAAQQDQPTEAAARRAARKSVVRNGRVAGRSARGKTAKTQRVTR
jgi:MarR family transcriptional regulator, transcriptional regulator for hemolysin